MADDRIHDSHNVVRTLDDFNRRLYYCLECAEYSVLGLMRPCRGEHDRGNTVLPHHLPRGAIIRG